MKILVSGASGLVGSAAVARLSEGGHDFLALSRGQGPGVHWNVATGQLDEGHLNRWGGPDAVLHLAGENIAASRWTETQKRRIRESRVDATEKLARTLLTLGHPPRVFLGASAVGIYGNCGDRVLSEEAPAGNDFLSGVSTAWEHAAKPLEEAGVRVVHLRFGMILCALGGALARMLPIFRLGAGGRLGTGRQWVSWISLEDAVRAIEFCLATPLAGAVNAVAPNPATNSEFTKKLARAVHRPAPFPAPAFALRLAFGEMADAVLLASQRAVPKRLLEAGFAFSHPTLEETFEAVLK